MIRYLVLMRYWARLIASGVPEIATVRSLDPSSELEILMVAPESCLYKVKHFTLIFNLKVTLKENTVQSQESLGLAIPDYGS